MHYKWAAYVWRGDLAIVKEDVDNASAARAIFHRFVVVPDPDATYNGRLVQVDANPVLTY